MLKQTRASCPVLLVSSLLAVLAWPIGAEGQPLKLDGTATCFRALLEISEEYRAKHGGPEFEIRYGGPFAAVERLGKREIDIGVVEFPLVRHVDKAWAKAFPQGARLPAEYTFAQTALGAVVHKRNPLSKLTCDQLKDILSGKTRMWQALVGRGGGIKVLTSRALSSTMVSDMILYYGSWHDAVELLDADANVLATVAGDALAIGFVALTPDLPTDVKLVAVAANAKAGAVPPTIENVVLERYPLVRQYKLLLTEQSPPAAHEFAKFACSDEAQKTVHRWGLCPATIRGAAEAEQRVADVKAGKGQPVAVCDLAGVGEAMKAAALEFARAKMAVQVTLDAAGGSAEQVVAKLKTGEVELMVVDGGLEEALPRQGMEDGGVGRGRGSRAVGVVVHPGNGFNELTMDDLRQILAGKVDRWPGATGTAERIVLYGLPPANPLMPLVDRAMGSDLKRTKVTVRPDAERVMLSVAAQPGALGLVDLTKVARHETKVKLLAILAPGEMEAATAAPDRVPEGYPLASPVALHLLPKASEAAKSFFAFLNEGGGRRQRTASRYAQATGGRATSGRG
ncbi:MAG: substrate-binding domain-containing protein [Patescibacteria group bacterium]|nr:substrate-binding domain-containing protein [Patescibacteria group bacterium]